MCAASCAFRNALRAINDPPPESATPDRIEFRQGKIALYIACQTQAVVDDLWQKLADGGRELPCGWVQDRYGFAWNIVPRGLRDVLSGKDAESSQRALQSMLQMGKLAIDEPRRSLTKRARSARDTHDAREDHGIPVTSEALAGTRVSSRLPSATASRAA